MMEIKARVEEKRQQRFQYAIRSKNQTCMELDTFN